MKFLKKRPVAITIMVLAIVLSIGIGFLKGAPAAARDPGLDTSLDTAYYERFIYDQADVLNNSAEKTLAQYLANWDARYNSVVAFMSVNSVSGDPEDYAYDLAADYDLGDGDALLLVVKNTDGYQFVWGDDFDTIMNTKSIDQLAAAMDNGEWQSCVLLFYSTLNDIYTANFGMGNGSSGSQSSQGGSSSYRPGHRTSYGSVIILAVIMIVVVILLLSAIDRSRYNAYRSQYYGVVNPPVVFRPILFWHGPRSSWYRRSWHQPAPPSAPGPRGPGFSGGFMGPSSGSRPTGGSQPAGGSRPSGSTSGFGGAGNRGPRGTGFSGGTRSGGSSGSSSRPSSGFGGGSFGGSSGGSSFGGTRGGGSSFGGSRSGGTSFGGGSRSSFGGGRSGGFSGGGRSGGFSGGSRGGGFGGGSRGGGFGGRR